ncbi:MAG: response regulator transcription factor [Chloroflexi bacterium]|nr:response regulator transcription factor [Chloroflexota bacterium]
MPVVLLITEDSVFGDLVARNLQERSYHVETRVVSAAWAGEPAPRADSPPDSCILELGWFDHARAAHYARLAQWSRELSCPTVLVVDSSWPQAWVQAFEARAVLRKPFAMAVLVRTVDEVGKAQAVAGPGGNKQE